MFAAIRFHSVTVLPAGCPWTGADGPLRASVVCVYTNTRDGHFWIDHHPQHPQVIIASPCSGHGFKFAPVIGEVLADIVQDMPPRFDLQLFRRR